MIRSYLSLGSNLNNPTAQIKTALTELDAIANTHLISYSHLYQTKPVGFIGQPDFINAAVEIETSLSPLDLLLALQTIESQHQRIRKQHWGPRTLDLDVLLYGNQTIEVERLLIPHPRMKERLFVLIPLAEIAPDLILPDGESLQEILRKQMQIPSQVEILTDPT